MPLLQPPGFHRSPTLKALRCTCDPKGHWVDSTCLDPLWPFHVLCPQLGGPHGMLAPPLANSAWIPCPSLECLLLESRCNSLQSWVTSGSPRLPAPSPQEVWITVVAGCSLLGALGENLFTASLPVLWQLPAMPGISWLADTVAAWLPQWSRGFLPCGLLSRSASSKGTWF